MRPQIRLKSQEMRSHRFANALQTLLLLAAMLAFLAGVGFLLAGLAGILWALPLGLMSYGLSRIVAPGLILRLYRARLLSFEEAPGLYQIAQALAERAELERVPLLYYVPSSMLNAFAVNLRGRSAIGITDGLLRHLSSREIACVLAHEVGHIRHRDVAVMGLADAVSRLTQLFSVFGQVLLLVNLPLLWMERATLAWWPIILLVAAPSLNSLLQLALSRTREFDADLEAVRLTGDPQAFISALEKIEYQGAGLFERIFFPGRKVPAPSLLRTHPGTAERIRRIRSFMEVYEPKYPLLALADWLPFAFARIQGRPRWRVGGLWY